jgi:hypothetical protein
MYILLKKKNLFFNSFQKITQQNKDFSLTNFTISDVKFHIQVLIEILNLKSGILEI